ncbi:MAG: T9SS type A sorting domain-containing protein [Candidatus Marinimicrobia bacterium]|nr:T9SS type A sorting domain-containing protein [Candidatus Neomarinimicrobiota bacterium]
MKRIATLIVLLIMCVSFAYAQSPSMVFFKGELPDSMYFWPWGFAQDPVAVNGIGYTPGTAGIQWVTSAEDGWQGNFIGLNSNVGNDMSSIWATDSVYFKMRAPNGLDADDSMSVFLYDSDNSTWDYTVWAQIDDFADLNDGAWHQYSIALSDFLTTTNDIDKTDIVALSFEAENPFQWEMDNGVSAEVHIDDVWIGQPEIPMTMIIYNGQSLSAGIDTDYWGFEENSLTLAEGEGYGAGTPAIVWETSNWDWQGQGYTFWQQPQDFTYAMAHDTLKMKVKAPAEIDPLVVRWYDWSDNAADFVMDTTLWDGEWQALEIPLASFTQGDGFDASTVYYFSIEAVWNTVPERVLFDDIWIGSPTVSVDVVAPLAPTNVLAGVATDYFNEIAWTAVAGESGESYNVYASLSPIESLDDDGLTVVKYGADDGEVVVHPIYHPLEEAEIAYYYAVTCMDAAGNLSEGFATAGPFTNVGASRAIISLEPPVNFVADSDLSEWAHIVPFTVTPGSHPVEGTIDSDADFSYQAYVAMDETYLYVAFDVLDDHFTWTEDNTVDWWDDEGIEFYFGLYELGIPHPYFYSGEEPDYRLVFLPNTILWGSDWDMEPSADDYIFEPLGESDYIIEARIAFTSIYDTGDAEFTPVEGMTIPFEILGFDADVQNGYNEGRLQLGANSEINPWHSGPDVWTYAWVGLPDFVVALDDTKSGLPTSFALKDNYPNPFNPLTHINYELPETADVKLTIYNIRGEVVSTLVENNQTAGYYTATFNAQNVSSGLYFYQIQAGSYNQTKKMILVK